MKHTSSKSEAKRIIIVDDHPVVRKGISYLIDREPNLEVCAEFDEGASLIAQLPQLRPDAVILDLFLKDENGIDILKEIKKKFPKLPVLVLSMQDELLYAERVLSAGGLGYVSKDKMLDKVVDALQEILKGRIYTDVVVKNKLLKKMTTHAVDRDQQTIFDKLSDRELEVFQLLGQGFSTRKIAERWGRSIKTVGTYRSHLKLKLNISDSKELVRRAAQWVKKGK